MSKIRLTKGELKKQRDSLKQFRHYLPTLLLKKQQLQMKILEVRREMAKKQGDLNTKETDIGKWVGILADRGVDITEWVTPVKILTGKTNVAGANVPTLEQIIFSEREYDFFKTPFWIDQAIREIKEYVRLMVDVAVIKNQIEVLQQELRTTTQRVNLFEKVKIPECIENIRKITIYLGDQMANAVGISKVAKKKIEESSAQELVAA